MILGPGPTDSAAGPKRVGARPCAAASRRASSNAKETACKNDIEQTNKQPGTLQNSPKFRLGSCSARALHPSQRITNAYGAPAPARSDPQEWLQIPAGPQPQRPPPITAGHKCPRGPSPSASLPSKGVTNGYGALIPAHSARHNGSHLPAGPQPQRAPPVAAGRKFTRGPSPSASRPPQRVTEGGGRAGGRAGGRGGRARAGGRGPKSLLKFYLRGVSHHALPPRGTRPRVDRVRDRSP